MDAKILKTKSFGEFSLIDALAVGGLKPFTERLIAATPIGNGTILSGVAKLGGSWAVSKALGGRFGGIVATALAVDGGEDLVRGVTDLLFGGAQAGPAGGRGVM